MVRLGRSGYVLLAYERRGYKHTVDNRDNREVTFPSTFLWGTATAAHQVEGGNVYNDNWVLEHVPGSSYVESSGDACDHYHRYREDIALLADLGFTLYRFSLEWSR